MFKNNVNIVQQRQSSGKDSKQLRRDIQLHFPDISEDELKSILPAKAEVTVLKLSNRCQVYSVDGVLLFFDPEGRGDLLVPTVYTLWRLPHILPAVQTYSEVSPKVLGGADLFLQGFIVPEQGLPHFQEGDLMAVTIPSNAFPFAVGVMETSSDAIAKSGLKGKGVKLLHHFGDQLWGLGDKSSPDQSFTPSRIFPQETRDVPRPLQAHATGEKTTPLEDTTGPTGVRMAELKVGEQEAPKDAGGDALPESAEVQAGGEGSPGEAQVEMSQDELAVHCLLAGLQTLKDSELPIMTSDFYSRHMIPAKPQGITMDIKKSSFKKLSKLLQKYEKKGLLTQKVIHKQDHINSVDRENAVYNATAKKSSGSQLTNDTTQPTASSSGAARPSTKIEISYCYRFPSSLRPILGATSHAANKDELFTEQQVRAALREYAVANSLASEDGRSAKLDKLLHGNLFNKKEEYTEGDPHPLEDLEVRLLGKLQLFHKIVRTSDQGPPIEQVQKGQVKNISIQMEDRQGGRKHVTKLTHVESFGLNPDELAGVLQRKFQTSSSVQKLPGKNETGKEILLQGDLLSSIQAFLTATYGIDEKYISSASKKKSVK